MLRSRIYCDYNATAPLRPEARAAMLDALDRFGNPSSVHAEGRAARARVESAREQVAAAIGACREDLAFVSGGTEAAQMPLLGALKADPTLGLMVSPIEHDCLARLPQGVVAGRTLASGVMDLDSLGDALGRATSTGKRPLVSLMLVNNETGAIQPVAEAADMVHAAGGLIHCDAAQALGKLPVSILDLDVDYLSLSAHKAGGPKGVGAVFVRPGAPFLASQSGGGQELGRRAGTENVPGIAGFGAAAEAAVRGLDAYASLAVHRDTMETQLKSGVPSMVVHGEGARRVAGVSCFGVDGWAAETQIMSLDLAGFALSAGAACSSGKVKPSRVLLAMGLSEGLARSSIRASLGWASEAEDFRRLADAWLAQVRRSRPALASREAAGA